MTPHYEKHIHLILACLFQTNKQLTYTEKDRRMKRDRGRERAKESRGQKKSKHFREGGEIDELSQVTHQFVSMSQPGVFTHDLFATRFSVDYQ